MLLTRLSHYIDGTPHDSSSLWRMTDLVDMSSRPPPDAMLPRNEPMLRADAYAIWFRWFMEGLCNPLRYVEDETKTIIDVLADVLARVDALYSSEPQDERIAFAQKISQRIMLEVERHRQLKRVGASRAIKRDLVDAAGSEPRCWICGFKFSGQAVDRFLKKRKGIELDLPKFVDVLKPRGILSRDIRIEVDHIVPVAGGGGGKDNLALACGWCNKSKGARTSIYDADGRPPRSVYALGSVVWHELPHPFWTVRILATRARCEHAGGCSATVKNAELFIAPGDARGAPNPSNLHIYCAEHDPYAAHRFFGREVAKRIWDDRARAVA
ncbi:MULTISPECIES: HNH endonuclease signature motif containing protein [Rhodomicrobium]|uniref:HNH endonuclease n=1 Tax=Rhodomicrobium TaxID=1068 RepID=UPI000B4B500B|nr:MULTISPECIES: HNH endonuclease signature motif containing protein [Rhodomicrobium]